MRSPASTCWGFGSAIRRTVPAIGAVIAASIFIASIDATGWPASTVAPSSTDTVTTPENGAPTCPLRDGSAFSTELTFTSTERSRTSTGRSWPLRVAMTVRMPASSMSPIASSPTYRVMPLSISTTCSAPTRRPYR